MRINQPITTFMKDSILNPLHLIETKFNEFADILQNKLIELNNKIEKLEKEN